MAAAIYVAKPRCGVPHDFAYPRALDYVRTGLESQHVTIRNGLLVSRIDEDRTPNRTREVVNDRPMVSVA